MIKIRVCRRNLREPNFAENGTVWLSRAQGALGMPTAGLGRRRRGSRDGEHSVRRVRRGSRRIRPNSGTQRYASSIARRRLGPPAIRTERRIYTRRIPPPRRQSRPRGLPAFVYALAPAPR